MNLDEERERARANLHRVKMAGNAAGNSASLVGLKTFNALFNPWVLVALVIIVGGVTWGVVTYLKSQEEQQALQSARDRMAEEFAGAITNPLDAALTEVDIRNGRCTFAFKTVECAYGTYTVSNGVLVRQ